MTQTRPLHHPLHLEIEAKLNAGSFDDAQRLLAQLGVGREHMHATTYFATRILYQRGKLELPDVVARLRELLGACPEFPEVSAMLQAAERGTLRPDARRFREATLSRPEGPGDDDQDPDGERPTRPGPAASSAPPVQARLDTPQAPGIPRAPLVPRFTPRQDQVPSYAPLAERQPAPPDLDLDLLPGSAASPEQTNTSPAATSLPPPHLLPERHTAPSPGVQPQEPETPSVFSIATWLAERDFERALSALETLGADRTPELSLLEVRAQIGLGRKAAARRALERLCRAPLLDPDLRAAVARLLIELGDTARAEAQARRARDEDPDSKLSRLTLAWALARNQAWLPSAPCAAELSALLSDFAPETCAFPALGFSLCALVLLESSPDGAREAADAALSLDPACQDGLALAALAAQKQSRVADARRFYQRLLDVDSRAADELAATLAKLGLAVRRGPTQSSGRASTAPPPAPARPAAPEPAAGAVRPSPWEDSERSLSDGDGMAARFEFEQGLARQLEGLPARLPTRALAQVAMLTARYLTEAVVSRHFAPYDLSLFSIARLDAALALLYAARGNAGGPQHERALLGLAAYTGECLRRAYAGEWLGTTHDLMRLHIEGQGLCFAPFRDMSARLRLGRPLELGDSPLPHPGAEPHGQRVSLDVSPPAPWDPARWPAVGRLPELGARLRDSPVGSYCAATELPLDLSFASLRSIDRYVTLLAPPLAPPDPEAAWVLRAAVLVGAYLGEVLRATHSADWEAPRGELRAEAYRLALPGRETALPIVAAYERLSGRRLEQPSDYARRVTS